MTSIPAPPSIDPARLADSRLTLCAIGPGGDLLIHYDPRTAAAAVFHAAAGCWSIWGPVPLVDFVALLAARGIALPPTEEVRQWIVACTEQAFADLPAAAARH